MYRAHSSGDLEAGPSGTYSGGNPFAAAMAREDLHNLKPILEDDGRPSIDVRRSSHMLEGANGEHVSRQIRVWHLLNCSFVRILITQYNMNPDINNLSRSVSLYF